MNSDYSGEYDPPPSCVGVYACRVEDIDTPGLQKDVFLMWHDRQWSYLGSDQRCRLTVHGWVGPIPRTRIRT